MDQNIDQTALVELVDQVAELSTALEAAVAEVEELKRVKAEQPVEGEQAEAEVKRVLNLAVKSANVETPLVKRGKIQVKAVDGGTKFGAAGDTVIADWNRQITDRIRLASELVSFFGHETAAAADYSKKISKGTHQFSWAGDYNSAPPVLVDVKATHGELTGSPAVKKSVAADSFFDAMSYLQETAMADAANLAALALLEGDGTNKPKGLTKHFSKTEGVKPLATRDVETFASVVSAGDDSLIDELRAMVTAVPKAYRGNCRWGMSTNDYQKIAALKDGEKRSLIQPDPSNALVMTLFGYEIVIDPVLEDNLVMFGDFAAGFKVVDLPSELDVVANPYRVPGHMVFDITLRVGAIVGSNDAIVGLFLA